MNQNENQLSYLNDQERLFVYEQIVQGCNHLWSKGKLQEEKLKHILDRFIDLGQQDPFFLAHFTSYAITKMDSKDLQVVSTFANSLSDADGTPFSPGSQYKKPNLRLVSQAATQMLDSKLLYRVIEIANMKQSLGSKSEQGATRFKEGTHFSRSLKTAIEKYIRYREANPKAIEGVKKVGLAKTYRELYKSIHIAPSIEAATILGWNQGSKKNDKHPVVKVKKSDFFNFKDLTDIEIAEKIRKDKLPPTGVLGALPGKISPVIAVAILEQATGNQAVILRELFDSQGLLKNKEVMKVFTEKIKTAKTALDRVEKINTEVDEEVNLVLKAAKAEVRKNAVGNIGKIFLHVDKSSSMSGAIDFAKDRAAIIAECVKDPKVNFFWGLFGSNGVVLKNPDTFEKDAFTAMLYGVRASDGSTNCMACYEWARSQGCDIDIFVTDQGHNVGTISNFIKLADKKGLSRPRAAVIVDFSGQGLNGHLAQALQREGIPVGIIQPNSLTESALVSQTVKTSLMGATAIIDEIMNTPLLKLPSWWSSI